MESTRGLDADARGAGFNLHRADVKKRTAPGVVSTRFRRASTFLGKLLSRQVLKLFIAMGAESLDLHTLFEAGGNDPASRQRVLDVVTRLADTGYLESRGSDFYLLTDKGRRAAR